jgi:hypothetical protein
MISYRRFNEFLKVAFGPHVSIFHWWAILKAGFSIARSSVTHAEWTRRTRICYACPIFDKARKTCQPHIKSELGCGCYVPYSNLVKKSCWGRERFGENFGW